MWNEIRNNVGLIAEWRAAYTDQDRVTWYEVAEPDELETYFTDVYPPNLFGE